MEMQRRDGYTFRPCTMQLKLRKQSAFPSSEIAFCFLGIVALFFSFALNGHPILIYEPAPTKSARWQDESFQRGLAALKENRFEDALEALTAAEQEHGDDPRVRTFRGIVLGHLGRTSEAAAEYQEAIGIDPQFEDAYRNLGFLEWTEHRLEPARDNLSRAVELSPDDLFAHYYLGRVQLDAQSYIEAFRELKLSRMPFPNDAEFLISAAAGYEALGENADARKTLDQLTPLSLSDSQSVRTASLFLAIHENENAIGILKRINAREPANDASWAQFDLAMAYLLAGNYGSAVTQGRAYINFLKSKTSHAEKLCDGWSLIGIAEARRGNGNQAVDALRKAAKLSHYDEEGWLNLTRELMELSRYADALSATREGIAANPSSYTLHLRLGAVHIAAGHYTEAESVFRTLVAAGDPLPTSYVGLAQALLREDRAEEAASELAEAQQKIGTSFLISYFMGLALERAGKPLEAMNAYRDALRQNSNSSEAHLGLGKIQLTAGRVNDSIVELEAALSINPRNVQARRLLSQAYRRAGDTDRALRYAESSTQEVSAQEGDLLGDFLLPKWQVPPENKQN